MFFYIGVAIITAFCPFLGAVLSLFGIRFDFKHWRVYITCVAFTLAVMAYFYVPTSDSDITRYFMAVQTYGRLPLSYILESFVTGRQYFITFSMMCWVIGHYMTMHMLPATVVFIVFWITQYLTCKIAEDYKIHPKYVSVYIGIMLLALSFYNVTNNIRNILAFSLIGLAVFRDSYQKRRDPFTYVLYGLAFFLHSSSLVLLILRYMLRHLKRFRVAALFMIIIAPPLVRVSETIVMKIPSSNAAIAIFKNMIVKAAGYYTHADASWAVKASQSGAVMVMKMLYLTLTVLFVCILYPMIRHKRIGRLPFTKERLLGLLSGHGTVSEGQFLYFDFIYYICMMTFACIPMTMPEYYRFASLVLVMGGPVYLLASVSDNTPVFGVRITRYMPIVAAMGCVIWFRNMWLYSDVVSMVRDTATHCPVIELLKLCNVL